LGRERSAELPVLGRRPGGCYRGFPAARAASSFWSAVRAVAEVYGPTATSEAISAATSPGVSVNGGKLSGYIQAVAAAWPAPDLDGHSGRAEPGDVALDGSYGRAGAGREPCAGDEPRGAGA
jgi:hypothetical protein